jgi:aryl sulfotransferase
MLFNGRTDLAFAEISPWVDLRLPSKEEKIAAIDAQKHRRFLKTHLPVDALVFSPKAKYLYIGRDGRDVVWSLYNHHAGLNDFAYELLNGVPGMVGPPFPRLDTDDVTEYFRRWVEHDGYPWWPFWENVRTWWEVRDMPNVMLVHFQNLKNDMEGMMRAIAGFLEIPIDEEKWPEIVDHCTFDYMKKNAASSTPLGGIIWEGGAETFIHRGVNGRWRDTLSDRDIALYERRAVVELGEDCAHWLATGDRSAL